MRFYLVSSMAIFKETPLYFPWNQLFMHALYKHKSMSFIVVMKPCKESNRGRLTLQGVQDHFEAKKKAANGGFFKDHFQI